MDRYICKSCNKTFHHYPVNNSESKLVKVLKTHCLKCGSFDIDLTEHGKLLVERARKIQRLNEIGSK